ncbi:MAG: GlxA family transcriptional regulator [Gammaproteobacteria bacterium]
MDQTVASTVPVRYGFLLLPQYSLIALSSVLEPLRMANQLSGRKLYEWAILTVDGEPVSASNGMLVQPDTGIDKAGYMDMVCVCGGINVRLAGDRKVFNWVRQLARKEITLAGICTGSHLLARAGVLDGYRATIHWENIAALREEFSKIELTDELFVMDRDRYTCSGGIAPLDMMLTLISQEHGIELAADISEEYIHDRIRTTNDKQRSPLKLRIGLGHAKLVEAVCLMEANIEEPIPLDDLARYACLSRRQMERLFRKYLNTVPIRYYLNLRLGRARQLLLQTDMSITDIAIICGFTSTPHFSKCYRDLYGWSPIRERRQPVSGYERKSVANEEATE